PTRRSSDLKAGLILVLAVGAGLRAWGAQWWMQKGGAGQVVAAPSQPAAPAAKPAPKVRVEVASVDKVRLERTVSAVGTLRSRDSRSEERRVGKECRSRWT